MQEAGLTQLSGREKVTVPKGCQMEDSHQPIYAKTNSNAGRCLQEERDFKVPFQGYSLKNKKQVQSWSSVFHGEYDDAAMCRMAVGK